jgi:ubiquinone/menaquinone biosynthesis C-methylase UbiE
MTMSEAETRLLERATPYLRRPTGREGPLEISDGVLDLLGAGPARSGAQKSLDSKSIAWGYDRFRQGPLRKLVGLPDFATESARLLRGLALEPGDVVLDLACGHGNFTEVLARAVGPEGLVIGVDISPAMLARAVARLRRQALGNVLLVLGDAHDLPIADASLEKLNCSGGFHSMPDLPKALAELRRASRPGARLTTSSFAQSATDQRARAKRWLRRRFAVNFVRLDWLGHELEGLGFQDYDASLIGGWVGYASARLAPGV